MERTEEKADDSLTEAVELYKVLQNKPAGFILDTWLIEYYERRKAVNFIRSKGLYAEYIAADCVKIVKI